MKDYGVRYTKEQNSTYCKNYRNQNKEKSREYHRNYYLKKKQEKNDLIGLSSLFLYSNTLGKSV